MVLEVQNQQPQPLQVHVAGDYTTKGGCHNHCIDGGPTTFAVFHHHHHHHPSSPPFPFASRVAKVSQFTDRKDLLYKDEEKELTVSKRRKDDEPKERTEARPQVELVSTKEPSSSRVPKPFADCVANIPTELVCLVGAEPPGRVPQVLDESGDYVDDAGGVPEVPHVCDASRGGSQVPQMQELCSA